MPLGKKGWAFVFGGVAAFTLAYFFLLLPRSSVRNTASEMLEKHPSLHNVPQLDRLQGSLPLLAHVVAPGIRFSVPWTDEGMREEDMGRYRVLTFEESRLVALDEESFSMRDFMVESLEKEGLSQNLVRENLEASTLEFYRAILNTGEESFSLAQAPHELRLNLVRLTLKAMMSNLDTIKEFHLSKFTVFQFGDPSQHRRVSFLVFDDKDLVLEFFAAATETATSPLTQQEIDTMLGSLRTAD